MPKFEPRSAVVTIYTGDYLDRLRYLEQQYDAALKAERNTTRLMSEVPESYKLFEAHSALKIEASENAIDLHLFALGRRQWRTLVGEHPARQGNEADQGIGVNEDTFKDALVPLSLVYPLEHELAGVAQISDEDLDRLSDIDFDRLYFTAFGLNRSPAANPKALALPQSHKSDAS